MSAHRYLPAQAAVEDKTDDRVVRARVLDPQQSFIVRAPAGSGKTTLLTRRFLALLAGVDAPEEIIAITFTRKAAAEMRHRIIRALEDAAGDGSDGVDSGAAAVLRRDRERGWDLLDDPARLRIQTIDAFAASIASAVPLASGLGGPVELVDDAESVYRDAARQLIADIEQDLTWSDAIAQVLAYLDNDVPRLEELLVEMLARRDQWLRLLRADADGGVMEAAVARLITGELVRVRGAIPDDARRAFLPLARYAGDKRRRQAPGDVLAILADLPELPPTDAGALPVWRAIADLLLTRDGQWRRRVTINEGFPADNKDPEARRCKEAFKELLGRLAQCAGLDSALHEIRHLPDPAIPPAQRALMDALLALLKTAAAYLDVMFAENNQADFTRIALAAERALGDPEQPTDLALALDHRISHLLVDEFQDTSVTQYELLMRLTAGWQAGDGRTLFLVGDPLQSIYRFREANVRLFEQVIEQQRLGGVPLAVERLSANFRSQPSLIEWLNRCFPVLNERVDTLQVSEVSYTPVVAEVAAAYHGGVRLHVCDGDQPDAGLRHIAGIIERTLRDEPGQTVAVLARSRRHVEGLREVLRDIGIPAHAGDIDDLAAGTVVRDLTALSCALLHPADRVAWLAVLRAPWCGLTLDDLAVLTSFSDQDSIRALIANERCITRLSPDGQQRLRYLGDVFGRAGTANCGVRLLVEGVWTAVGGPGCLETVAEFEQARRFFERLTVLERDSRPVTRQRLMRELDRVRPGGAGSAAEQVLVTTIHKAKGLEFDTVIIPAIEKTIARDRQRLLEWSEVIWGDSDPNLLFAPIPERGPNPEHAERTLYELIRRRERLEHMLESRRLLYVALTRARRAVHLIGTLPEARGSQGPAAGSLLEILWPVLQADPDLAELSSDSVPVTAAANHADDVRMSPPLRRMSAVWRPPDPPRGLRFAPQARRSVPVPEFEWAGVQAKYVGTVVHEWLQGIAADGIENWNSDWQAAIRPALVARFRGMGMYGQQCTEGVERVTDALTTALSDRRGRWVLSGRHRDACAELRISGMLNGEVISAVIDRSFIDETGVRWIIDYKTSMHVGGSLDEFIESERQRYRQQLERYAMLLSAIEDLPIRLGLYFPLLRRWCEWGYIRPLDNAPLTSADPDQRDEGR